MSQEKVYSILVTGLFVCLLVLLLYGLQYVVTTFFLGRTQKSTSDKSEPKYQIKPTKIVEMATYCNLPVEALISYPGSNGWIPIRCKVKRSDKTGEAESLFYKNWVMFHPEKQYEIPLPPDVWSFVCEWQGQNEKDECTRLLDDLRNYEPPTVTEEPTTTTTTRKSNVGLVDSE